MVNKKIEELLKKQHYEVVGEHSAVQVCRWTKKSLRDEGVCYKEQFYGIKSHLCCQMTPSLWCPNQCLHCWRAIEFTTGNKIPGKISGPKEIIDGCINAQKKLLGGFKILPKTRYKTVSKANMKKWEEAQEPMQFAISLSGEPTVYPHIGELMRELNQRGKTSFLVTNGLYPEKIKDMAKKNQLPTQIYVSVNAPNKKLYDEIHRSCEKNAWEKLNETLEIFSEIRSKTRTVFRMNLVKDLNMIEAENYAKMIKKTNPLFVEIKGFISVGFARQRIAYEKMPLHEEIIEFAEKIIAELKKLGVEIKILDEKKESRVVVLGKNKGELKIRI
jgi:tRNA wybutosine-synthesizing protein 1